MVGGGSSASLPGWSSSTGQLVDWATEPLGRRQQGGARCVGGLSRATPRACRPRSCHPQALPPSSSASPPLLLRVGAVAEAEGHHPDLHLVGYNRVTAELSTHSGEGRGTPTCRLAASSGCSVCSTRWPPALLLFTAGACLRWLRVFLSPALPSRPHRLHPWPWLPPCPLPPPPAAKGLTENDFILAAKIDALPGPDVKH